MPRLQQSRSGYTIFGVLEDLYVEWIGSRFLLQGSGWGWLGYSPELKRLVITTTANQDPLSTQVFLSAPSLPNVPQLHDLACVTLLRLQVIDTHDHLQGLVPLLGVDMWEHAYYLQYNNVKADYLKEIWKIVNWKDVGARYSKAQ